MDVGILRMLPNMHPTLPGAGWPRGSPAAITQEPQHPLSAALPGSKGGPEDPAQAGLNRTVDAVPLPHDTVSERPENKLPLLSYA